MSGSDGSGLMSSAGLVRYFDAEDTVVDRPEILADGV